MSDDHIEADVIVIGGGASGITAAVAAAERDASVIVIEKGGTTGGAANMGMGFFAVGSKYQRAQLVDFTQEDAFRLFMEYTHWRVDARLVRRYIAQSAGTIEWIEGMGVEFLGAFKYFAQSTQTWHIVKAPGSTAPTERAASGLYRALTERAQELGVQIIYRARATGIRVAGGHATAVEWAGEDGTTTVGECNAVIVATGGFGDNPKMISDHLGFEWGRDLHSFRIPGVAGDGLRLLWEVGAGATTPVMELTYTTPGVTDVFKTLSETMRQPNLMVNLEGQRFVNEEIMNNTVYTGNAIARQRERVAFTLVDDAIVDGYRRTGLDYVTVHHGVRTVDRWDRELEAYLAGADIATSGLSELHTDEQKHQRHFFAAGSLDEVAESTGIDAGNLGDTVAEYNAACRATDDLFFKPHRFLRPVEGPTFYVARHFPAGYGSLGGVSVNDRLEVLDRRGLPIPGLYAAGTDACNIFGDSYCFYLPGNTMGFAINSGRMAGYHAVEYMDSDAF
ncbi:MAG: FAD-dependent oxidoreductase [Dactylosporangium sp.]|nr:FAD-dependent oxidoreductase [Dactylosporangium sp.]NNJ61843.1 FAD-dependent oxidoreductase [Dactylosporangium sp.]